MPVGGLNVKDRDLWVDSRCGRLKVFAIAESSRMSREMTPDGVGNRRARRSMTFSRAPHPREFREQVAGVHRVPPWQRRHAARC